MILQKCIGKWEALSRPALKRVLPKECFERLTFFLRLGYWPDLKAPKSFNEKIAFRKLHEAMLPRPELVDKLAVRDLVAERIGQDYLPEVLAVYQPGESVRLKDLPAGFALKCNTGSGMNRIVSDHNQTSDAALTALVEDWCARTYSERSHTYECIYDTIPPKAFAEELLEPLESYREYKFWCFDGQPAFVQVQLSDGYHVFTPEGDLADFSLFNPPAKAVGESPKRLPELLELAKTLAKGFDFVRVDLVVSGTEDRITFSELTFHPGGGRVRFFPREKDFELGERMPLLAKGPQVA